MSHETALALLSVLVPVALGSLLLLGGSGPWRRASAGARRDLALAMAGGGAVAAGTWAWLATFGAFTEASRFLVEGAASHAFWGAALPEETAKLAWLGVVLKSAGRPRPATPALAGALAGLALGLGFAAVENLAYAWQSGAANGAVRVLTAVPCHAFLGAVMGHYVGAFRATRRPVFMLKAWLVPTVAHGLYNFPLVLDPRAYPATSAAEDLLLAGLVLLWLAAWTRLLLARLTAPQTG